MKKLLVILALFIAVNGNAQWFQIGGPYNGTVRCFAASGTNIYAGLDGGVIRSTNNGTSWNAIGLANKFVSSIIVSGTNIYAGTYSHGIFKSTNNGINWSSAGLADKTIYSLAVLGTNIFASASSSIRGGVYLSTDNGGNWNAVDNGLSNQDVYSLATIGTNIFAGVWGAGVFLSTNNGTSWNDVSGGLTNRWILQLAVTGNYIFAGTVSYTGKGVFFSTNNGTNWQNPSNGLPNKDVYAFATTGRNILAGTTSGVYLSSNYGTSWTDKSQGLNITQPAFALLLTNNYIYIGIGHTIWRRVYSEVIGIHNTGIEIPDKFSLSQNYPNPFNPSTSIKYEIPVPSSVRLTIFNALGKEIETLVNEKQNAGTYETIFDASKYTSGVYFYRLIADGFSETKKMFLIK